MCGFLTTLLGYHKRSLIRVLAKRYLRWVMVIATIAFLAHTLVGHWAEVTAIRLQIHGGLLLLLALVTTLLAHCWSGWVWGWILQALQQPVSSRWSTRVYLKTNLLKYLPGNVWHFYGRVRALGDVGVARGPAIVGVVLEPLLMAAAALLLGLASPTRYWVGQLAMLGLVLVAIHPRWLNPLVNRLGRAKGADETTEPLPLIALQRYPLKSLVGELGFVLLRGIGFGLVVSAVSPLSAAVWPPVVSLFSLAWLAGLIIPGAPGGLGVFEAIAVTLLQDTLSAGVVLSAVALYRLVGTLAESIGAGLAVLGQRLASPAT
jgi:glycosyltransferase 2 family protein